MLFYTESYKRIINGNNFYGTFYGNKFIGIIVIQCYRSNGTVTGLETDSTVDVIMTKGLYHARKFFKEAKYNLEEELIKHKIWGGSLIVLFFFYFSVTSDKLAKKSYAIMRRGNDIRR